MTAEKLRQKYLDFFKERGHAIIPSASLIPEHDPTVLFTTAGMHPLTPFLLGERHPNGKRLVDVQKCIRTGDIEDVGDARHLTFFEMLGNWSLGDYWKKEAIEWSFEFLTKKEYLALASERLSVTVFAGEGDTPADEESARIWQNLGIPKERIFYLPKEDNWWGPAGQTGPCGPCTEMFYDTGKEKCGSDCGPGCKCAKYVEVWNDVFMEYNRKIKNPSPKHSPFLKGGGQGEEVEYEFVPLSQKNVDTGMGVERTLAVLNGKDNVYDTELFIPIIQKIEEICGRNYNPSSSPLKLRGEREERLKLRRGGEKNSPLAPLSIKGGDDGVIRAIRIIADHLKAAAFILAEGIEPSNVERGYVLRRLIRRAVRYGKQLGINEIFTFKVANIVIEMYRDIYPELHKSREFIEEQLVREEEKFGRTLERGLRQFQVQSSKFKVQSDSSKLKALPGEVIFDLYQTYGFPVELTEELAREEGLAVDRAGFNEALRKHQELSRAGAEQKFAGGLADHSEQVEKYHTAAHLMLAALRQVLGGHIVQRGSNITAERLRFDFSHPEKMTPEQIKQVEDLVNQKIQEDLPVQMQEMSLEEAKRQGAMGVFESRYGDKVKVYTIGRDDKIFSKEICGGPHIQRTGLLGHFKIIKEESVSAGVRRIKAVLE